MERLTAEATKTFIREAATLMSISKDNLRTHYNEIFDRLVLYEDTGMEPGEIPTGLEMANVYAIIRLLKQYESIGTVEQFWALMDYHNQVDELISQGICKHDAILAADFICSAKARDSAYGQEGEAL